MSLKKLSNRLVMKEFGRKIRDFDNYVITLDRKFKDNSIYMANCSFGEYSFHSSERLSTWHSDKNENNVSQCP